MNPQYIPPQPHHGMNNSVAGYGAPPGGPNYPMPPGANPQGGIMPPQGHNFPMRPPMSGPMPGNNFAPPNAMGGPNSNVRPGAGPGMVPTMMSPMGGNKMMAGPPSIPQGGHMGGSPGRMPGPPPPGSPHGTLPDPAGAYHNGKSKINNLD